MSLGNSAVDPFDFGISFHYPCQHIGHSIEHACHYQAPIAAEYAIPFAIFIGS